MCSRGQVSIFWMWTFRFCSICWIGCFFSNACFWQSCQESDGFRYMDLFCHSLLCLFFYANTMLFGYYGSVACLAVRYVVPPELHFLLKMALATQCLLYSPRNCTVVSSSSVKNVIGISMEIVLNWTMDCFGYYEHFNMLIFPIHECEKFFHFFVSSLISFFANFHCKGFYYLS
jgi:hypothetical protein